MTQSNILVIIWIVMAVWGIRVMTRAIGINTMLIETARSTKVIATVVNHLDNVLFMYKSRLILIVNNLLIGILSILVMLHIVSLPPIQLGLYISISLLVNEASFIFLTYRDLHLLEKEGESNV